MNFRLVVSGLITMLLVCCVGPVDTIDNAADLANAIREAKPGNVIRIANGTYQDIEIDFIGKGTADGPITLTVEEKGKVFFEGQSALRLSGDYLHVEGLVFRNGYTPVSEVIAFRTDKENVCNHCRVTECVIDNYNPAERFDSDIWVSLYGKYNRFDHNYLTGKRNQGVTVAVRLDTEASRENFHLIDHNYFGHRPVLGSNGGETLRIGTSHYCESNSNTQVIANYFDRCNGEVEIISNKSGQNVYRSNTFFESKGTLTIRHGNEVTIDNNYFFGNGVAHTGGIRIINAKQTVVNNYAEGLTGYRFRSALTVMNGVPNSPLNRYVQVTDSKANNNVFIDCDNVQFCVGSDAERSAVPENCQVADNVFVNRNRENIFSVFDDISGITFANNLLSPGLHPLQPAGFTNQEIELEEAGNGIKIPLHTSAGDSVRAGIAAMATAENTGVSWYPRQQDELIFGGGKIIEVPAGTNGLWEAVRNSAPGDVLRLTTAGEYLEKKDLKLHHPLTIEAAPGLAQKPVLLFERNSLFTIENGGGLTLRGVQVDGKECNDRPLNAVISTSRYSMINNYKLFVEDCDFTNLDVNHSFNFLRVYKNTMADSVVLRNSTFRNITGSVLALDQETDDIGIYNAESVVVENCLFDNIGHTAINLHRGGSDESTLGPMLTIDRCTFDEIGGDAKWNRSGAAILLHGVQIVRVANSIFNDSAPFLLHMVVGEPVVDFRNTVFSGGTNLIDNGKPFHRKNLLLGAEEPITTFADGTRIGTSLSE